MSYISNLASQDLTVFDPQAWAREMQLTYFKENVGRALVNEELRSELTEGTRINRPYRKALAGTDYTKGTSISSWNNLGGTNEYLDVDQVKIVPMYVDYLRLWLETTIENLAICWKLLRGETCKG